MTAKTKDEDIHDDRPDRARPSSTMISTLRHIACVLKRDRGPDPATPTDEGGELAEKK